ncbi:MAG: cytochrome c-type biogenesis protein CcmH [Gemmatimonadetes bacterium]|nr:cytochrome c-type biogenesis protein CcmH [Gemmatimonadota bacterium]
MMIGRRAWLAAMGVGQPEDTSTTGAADPLQRPDWVDGRRRVVSEYQNDPLVVGVERRLRCTCPCGLDIFTCRTTDFTCTYSPALHDEVVALVREGKTADEIIAAFVAKHGESILLAPKATGFGVLGYALPGAAILTVGGLLAWVLVRRAKLRAQAPVQVENPATPRAAPVLSDRERDQVERALRDLEA